jgi:DNA-binding NarL/FixJ family response regulator
MTLILVIEDEQSLREEIVTRLTFDGFDVLEASDGETGVQIAVERMPDLIVCDVTMPGMSGYEVLSELRSVTQTSAIPFIFLTARVMTSDLRTGMSLGADDYITKPFHYHDLTNAIRVRIEKRRQADSLMMENLSRHLVRKQDEERRAIAQQMSEGIYRPLTSMRLLLSTAKRLPPESVRTTLYEMNDTVTHLLEKIESLQTDLWPTSIDYLGIVPVLLWYFGQLSVSHQLRVDFQYEKLPDMIPDVVKNNLYYVIVEALNNVIQHAKSSEAKVRLWTSDGKIQCEVVDGGVGFEAATLFESQPAFGLLTMRERVRSCAGDLEVVSSQDAGTTIAFWIPLTQSTDYRPLLHSRAPSEVTTTTIQVQPVAAGISTVLVADESELARRSLRQIIDRIPNVRVVAECEHINQVIPLLKRHKIDTLVLDLELPGGNPLDLMPTLRERGYSIPVITMVHGTGNLFAWQALQKGAFACVLKSSSGEEMQDAVTSVLRGDRYISPVLSAQALASYMDSRNQEPIPEDKLETLTARERQILEMVANDYQNARIAEELVISIRTVETHRANLMRKLGLHTKSELVRYAIRRGITSVGE